MDRRVLPAPEPRALTGALGALALVLALAPTAGGDALRALRLDEGTPGARPAAAASDESPLPGALEPGVSARVDETLYAGLDWLAKQQEQTVDGSFPKGRANRHAPVGVAALSALAFMAAGSTPGRGPHGEALTRAIDYLLSRVDLVPGSPTYGFVGADGDPDSGMHGHGFATLALAEAFVVSPSSARGERIGAALEAAVNLIERTQGVEGGWEYKPARMALHEGSVTICLVQALRAAHEAGVRVDPAVIAKAEAYVLLLQSDDGAFRYTLEHDGRTSVALTAASLATLNAAGTYSGEVIERGTDAIWRYLADEDEGLREPSRWPFYERFYVAQAFWQHHERKHFERWWPRALQRILETRRADGSWGDREFGDCYATAMNCLVLALPEAVLPVFQR